MLLSMVYNGLEVEVYCFEIEVNGLREKFYAFLEFGGGVAFEILFLDIV